MHHAHIHVYDRIRRSAHQLESKEATVAKIPGKTRDRNPCFPADFPFNPFIESIFGVGVGFALQVLDY